MHHKRVVARCKMYEEKLWQTEDGGFIYLFIYFIFLQRLFVEGSQSLKSFIPMNLFSWIEYFGVTETS